MAEQATTRVPELVPIRYGRMAATPFTYYRGAALPMAADLSTGPRTSLEVQLCGDAHLCNFGGFASPERDLLFDVNDFDETAPGPFEWDLKRLAASFEIAARSRNFPAKTGRKLVTNSMCSYREAMREFATMSNLRGVVLPPGYGGHRAEGGALKSAAMCSRHFRRPPPRHNRRIS